MEAPTGRIRNGSYPAKAKRRWLHTGSNKRMEFVTETKHGMDGIAQFGGGQKERFPRTPSKERSGMVEPSIKR